MWDRLGRFYKQRGLAKVPSNKKRLPMAILAACRHLGTWSGKGVQAVGSVRAGL